MNNNGHIFISYKSEEHTYAEDVRTQLLKWGYETWMDAYNIPGGASWGDEIDKALKSAYAVTGIMTPKAMASRNVTNEWDMAIRLDKPFIPLLYEQCEPHYKYVDIQYIDFTQDKDLAFAKLKTDLESPPAKKTSDLYCDYLKTLFDRINTYLTQRIIRTLSEPIKLHTEVTPNAVLFEKRPEIDPLFVIGGLTPNEPEKEYNDFGQAFRHYDGRVLMLGEPGAGKSITLLHFGRDAVVRRMNDPSLPLPILAIIPEKQKPLLDWLSSMYGTPPNAEKVIREGKALLLLDGLDELGSEREEQKPDGTKQRYDPRLRFMDELRQLSEETKNQILVTCRRKDYEQIGSRIALNKAVTLKPLDVDQIRLYLAEFPELWEAVQTDDNLRHMLTTPLLISIFAFAYQDNLNGEERTQLSHLKDAGDVRDKIFEMYVRKRYEHEERKLRLNGVQLKFAQGELIDQLGRLALGESLRLYPDETQPYAVQILPDDVLVRSQIEEFLGQEQGTDFIDFATRIQILVPDGKDKYRFIHRLMYEFFAFRYAFAHLTSSDVDVRIRAVDVLGELKDPRAVDPLINLLHDENAAIRKNAVESLEKLGDTRALEPLICTLQDDDVSVRWYTCRALGSFGDARPVESLIQLLNDPDHFVRESAADALGEIGDPKAAKPLIPILNDPNEGTRWSAASALTKMGELGFKILILVLEHGNVLMRQVAIDALGESQEEKAVEFLIPMLNNTEEIPFYAYRICDIVARALLEIRTPEARAAFEAWWKDQENHESFDLTLI